LRDTVFALATGAWRERADVTRIGALAADVMADAILRAVRHAASIPGYPAIADWRR
jgi:L-aminopeptidase/D-esterase-like protein